MQRLKILGFKSVLDPINRNFKKNPIIQSYSNVRLNDYNEIKSKIKSLNAHRKISGTISKNIYLNLINKIEKTKECDSETALVLIKSCDMRLIELLPKERQLLLDNLFENLLPKLNVTYDQLHYDGYIESTLSNRYSFDPFKISRVMFAKNILTTLNTNTYFMKMLCESGEINVALLHLKNLLESKNIGLFDLNKYKNQTCNSQELYESVLHLLNSTSKTIDYFNVNLINPFLSYYFSTSNTEKAIKIFKQLPIVNLKPNNFTYFNLVKGYSGLHMFDEASKLYEKVENNLFLADKLSLLSTLDRSKVGQFLFDQIINSMQSQFEPPEKIVLVNEINYLCERELYEKALFLVKTFFSNEFNEKDPVKKDLIRVKIDVTDFMCRSLVLNSSSDDESIQVLRKFADLLDKENPSTSPYLTDMIHHSFSRLNIDFSFKLISQLKLKGAQIKLNHVLPLIKHQTNLLETRILQARTEPNYNIEHIPEFKSVVQLLVRVKNLGCQFEQIEVDAFMNCLKLDAENNFKSHLLFHDLFRMLKLSNLVENEADIFNECAYKLLRHLGDLLDKEGKEVDAIKFDLKDFHALVKEMSKNTIDKSILRNFYTHLKRLLILFENESRHDWEKDVILKIAELLNKNGIDCIYLKLIYEDLLKHFSELLKKDFVKMKEFQIYLRNNFESQFINKKMSDDLMNTYDSKSKEELEQMLKTEKNNFPLMRTLLIKMVNPKARGDFSVQRIEELIKDLPDEELTPLVCENLLNFYAHISKPRKSKYYFWKLIEKSNDSLSYKISGSRLIFFLKKQFDRRNFTHEITEIFNKLSDKKMLIQYESNSQEFKALNTFLIENVYVASLLDEFKILVETIYQSNFIPRNSSLTDLVMLKFIENKKLDKALEYYKFNLKENKKSVLEILLLSHLLADKNAFKKQISELVDCFDSNLANNALFLSHLMNHDFKAASEIFSKQMQGQLDLKALERLVNQCSSYNTSQYLDRLSSLTNVLVYLEKQKHQKIYEDVKKIFLKNKILSSNKR